MEKTITLDPKVLREECLSFGLCIRVCLDLIKEQKEEADPKAYEGVILVTSAFLYGEALGGVNDAIYASALAYERRQMEKLDGSLATFPAWGEEEESETQRLSDAFFALYALYLGHKEGQPEDYLGPILFFSGAINEDIAEGYNKKKGDPHYDAYYIELSSYPFAQAMKKTATQFYDAVHVVEEA